MFQAINVIKRHQENQSFVNDKDGNLAGDTTSKIAEITKHFTDVFQKDNAIKCPDIKPSKLQKPFTKEGVQRAIKSVKNNKSTGCYSLRTEHLKYAPDVIHEHIADLLNSASKTGEYPKEIKSSYFSLTFKNHFKTFLIFF